LPPILLTFFKKNTARSCHSMMLASLCLLACMSVCSSNAIYPSNSRQLLAAVDNCSQVIGYDANSLIEGSNPLDTVGVKGISYSISYSVSDAVRIVQETEMDNQECHIKVAKIINKAGEAVSANAAGAQASVRATNFNDPAQQQCSGKTSCRLFVLSSQVHMDDSMFFDRHRIVCKCLGCRRKGRLSHFIHGLRCGSCDQFKSKLS
jgi:hypothetical protein